MPRGKLLFNGEEPWFPNLGATKEGIQDNPLHAHHALLYALKGAVDSVDGFMGAECKRIELPPAVASYFEAAISNLLAVRKPNKDCPELVAEAFGIQAIHFRKLGEDQWEGRIFHRVKRLRDDGMTKEQALEVVAGEEGIEVSSLEERLKRITKEHRENTVS